MKKQMRFGQSNICSCRIVMALLLTMALSLSLIARVRATPQQAQPNASGGLPEIQMTSTGFITAVSTPLSSSQPGSINYHLSWTNETRPPFRSWIFQPNPQTDAAVTIHMQETVRVTITFPASGPATRRYTIKGYAGWDAGESSNPPLLNVTGNASDDLSDPYTTYLAGDGKTCGGASKGTHLLTYAASSGSVTFTKQLSFDVSFLNNSTSNYITCGTSLQFCSLNRLDPFPDEIAQSDPVVFYHGTDRDTADKIISGMPLLALGSADFGKGFYTATNKTGTSPKGFSGNGLLLAEVTAWRRVRNLGKRKPDGSLDLRWGTVEIDVPLSDMLSFFCTYQDLIVGFINTSPTATPPWNALLSPGTDQPYNKNPIPIAKNSPMNWFNFAWFNWYAYRCTTSQPFANDEGTNNYVPDWEPADFALLPDWRRALIWGRLFSPAGNCNQGPGGTMPPGSEFDTRNGGYGLNQYVWGSGGGLDFLNNTPTIIRRLVSFGETNPNP